jgi:hypothetical protein
VVKAGIGTTQSRWPPASRSAYWPNGSPCPRRRRSQAWGLRNRWFADSSLEGDGFELLVPRGDRSEFERSLIFARTQAGIEGARELGKTFGRPVKLNAKQRRMIAERYASGETMAALASEFSVGEATVWRALRGRPPCEAQ